MPKSRDYRDYEALTLIEGCLVTTPLDILPGLGIWPVADPRHRTGVALVMDRILEQAGWDGRVQNSDWLAQEHGDLPLAVVQQTLPAASREEALLHARIGLDIVLGILALRRGAAGIPLVTVVQRRDEDGNREVEAITTLRRRYRGNLLGGVISGEDVDDLGELFVASQDPLVRLWLLERWNIAAERDRSYELHRWWNLVEGIAASRGRPTEPVVDFSGSPLLWPGTGKAFDTSRQAGLVYAHIREMLTRRSIHERSFVAHSDNVWDLVVAWCGFRNAVAHHGQFDPGNPNQARQWWYRQTRAAHEWQQAGGRLIQQVAELGDLLLSYEVDYRTTRPRRTAPAEGSGSS